MNVPALAPHFQIELSRKGRMDEMTVHVEAAETGKGDQSPIAAAAAATAAADLVKRIKDVIGITTHVNVGQSGAVARSEGKAVRVVDNRQKD